MTVTANAPAEQPTWWAARADEQAAAITLYRVVGAKEELLDRVTVTLDTVPTLEDFQMLVKGEHGGGEYLAVQRGAQGQFLMRERFAIAGFAKKPTPPAEERQPGQLSELALLMQRSDERFAQVLGEIRELRNQPTAPAVDPLEQVERVASILNRTGAAPQPQKGLLEQLMEMKQATELMGWGGGQGDEQEGFGWVRELVSQAAPLLMSAAKGQGGGDTTAAPDQLPAPPVDDQAALMNKARLLLRAMVQLAGYNVPPAETVGKVQQQAGDAWPLLLEILHRDDAVTLAAGLVPEVAQHVEWFEGFRAAVLAPPAPAVEVKTKPTPGTARRQTRKTA